MGDDMVKVAVRIRPLITSEIERGCSSCLKVIPNEHQIQIPSIDKAFTFNYVFSPECDQIEFYNTGIKHMINNIFEGYNVTILAYGQSGSGKTHSMGTNYDENSENHGIIPRAVNDIFEQIKNTLDREFRVSVAFMELYKEQLYDLLSKKPRNQSIVDIREDIKGIKMVGLTDLNVNNTEETLKCLSEGCLCRATGSTAMNEQSSRSHAIFTICVHQQIKDNPNSAKFAKFHLVDLAGSERSKKTQATGERFKEGVNINKGLLALGNVISQLGEGGNGSYIGYRDSKLTRLLQDSLGGNAVTLMIACVSPADYNLDETISTLRYADRAKKIKNKPIVNQDERVAEIANLKGIIRELRLALQDQGKGVNFCPPEHTDLVEKNNVLQQKVRSLTENLNANLIKIVYLHEQTDLTEQAIEEAKVRIAKILEDCESLLGELSDEEFDKEACKIKLESLLVEIIALQNNQKKTDSELINRELSLNSTHNNSTNTSESLSVDLDGNEMNNETYLINKHEEHTLQQVQRVDEVQYINRQLAIKEELVSNLLKNSPQIAEYHKELETMEAEIKNLQKEREELIQALHNAQANNASSKISETRRKKVQELEKKINVLTRKCLEQTKIIKTKEKSDQQIKNLNNEITELKQTKVKLIRNMRSEVDKFNKWKRAKEQECYKLTNQDKKHLNQLTKLQQEHNKQKSVFKRKLEEVQAINKRLKDALDLQRKVAQNKEKYSKNKEDIKTWVTHELEILLSTVDAECTLQKLKQDRAYYLDKLAELKLNEQDDKKEIEEMVDYLDLRNKQIDEIAKHIKESDQENRSKTRWHMITSMSEAKEALKTLFDIITTNGKKYSLLQHEKNDLWEKSAKLREQFELMKLEYENEMKKVAVPELQLDSVINKEKLDQELDSKTEDQTLEFKEMKTKMQFYKNQCEQLQQQLQILTEANSNVPRKRSHKPKEENSFIELPFSDEESILYDDNEKDPDWKKTPLYHRIRNLEKTYKDAKENKVAVKRSSNGDVRCFCKTNCASRLCSCRKNKIGCENCSCNPEQCQNRGVETRRTLFVDNREFDSKKPRLKEESEASG